jgi:hypothetical protein
MNKTNLLLPAFIIVALAQLYIPARLIIDLGKSDIIGTEYKLLVNRPLPRVQSTSQERRIPFRTGRFDVNKISFPEESEFELGESLIVHFATGDDGFAIVNSVSKNVSEDDRDYVRAEVNYLFPDSVNEMLVLYSFERYFTVETLNAEVIEAYREALQDTTKTVYALINIAEGSFYYKGVFVDETRLSEYAKGVKKQIK